MTSLLLPEGVSERLLAHARGELPNESCALLGGDPATCAVTSLHLTENAAGSPYRFEVHPAELVRILHAIEAAGEQLVAIFHSHPATPPRPSATDVREAHYGVVHLIAGTESPSAPMQALRAWRFSSKEAEEIPIAVRAPGSGTLPSAGG